MSSFSLFEINIIALSPLGADNHFQLQRYKTDV